MRKNKPRMEEADRKKRKKVQQQSERVEVVRVIGKKRKTLWMIDAAEEVGVMRERVDAGQMEC